MRGNLAEIDIRSILRLLESEKQTGILYVESENPKMSHSDVFNRQNNRDKLTLFSEPESWFIFLIDGKITYISERHDSHLIRLHDYLSYYQLDSLIPVDKISVNTTNSLEYNYLIYLLQQQLITPQQTKNIICKIIYETLFDLLSLSRGRFIFKSDFALTPSIAEIKISSAIQTVSSQLKSWKQLYPYVRSPEECPLLNTQNLTDNITKSKAYITLSHWVDKQINLRRLSRHLNCYLVDLAKALYPYVQKGLVSLCRDRLNSSSLLLDSLSEQPTIVYVDNDVAIGKKVEYILKRRGYLYKIFTDSVGALTEILHIRPALVFCKIDLPQLSGHELCTILQSSWVCRNTKVIMLSEADNFFERTKAKVISADDYLSLPFTPNELLISIEKHLGKKTINNSSLGVEWSAKKNPN